MIRQDTCFWRPQKIFFGCWGDDLQFLLLVRNFVWLTQEWCIFLNGIFSK